MAATHSLAHTYTHSDRHINSLAETVAWSPVKTNKCTFSPPMISSNHQNERQEFGRNPVRISIGETSKHVNFTLDIM